MSARLRLADVLGGLSIVADLGFGLPQETAMRSCLIGTALARELGVAEGEVADTFYTCLLLHVGCTAFAHEAAAAMGDELTVNGAVAKTDFADPRDVLRTFIPEATRGMGRLSQLRATTFIVTRGKSFGKRHETASCEVARQTARRLGMPDTLQRALYEVHEWWKGGGGLEGSRARRSGCRRVSRALPATLRCSTISGDPSWLPTRSGAGQAGCSIRPSCRCSSGTPQPF
jgi:hypothetical protein